MYDLKNVIICYVYNSFLRLILFVTYIFERLVFIDFSVWKAAE